MIAADIADLPDGAREEWAGEGAVPALFRQLLRPNDGIAIDSASPPARVLVIRAVGIRC